MFDARGFLVDAVPQYPRQKFAQAAGCGKLLRMMAFAVARRLQSLPSKGGKCVVRRLRGEVRRYRRVIQEAESELSVSPYPCDQRLRDKLYAALAPRRRKKP